MTSLNQIKWLALAILAAPLTPSTCLAQRSTDQLDSYPAERNSRTNSPPDAEPPRLMRGGIMQQLRAVTDSVMGTGEDKRPSQAESRSNVPVPPPLSSVRRGNEPRKGSYSPDDFQASEATRQNAGQETGSGQDSPSMPSRQGPQGRAWAGQFLIPNYRLRDQVGSKPVRSQLQARRPLASADENSPARGTGGNLPEVPPGGRSPLGLPQPRAAASTDRRLYLGRGPEDQGVSENEQYAEELDEPYAPVERRSSQAAVPSNRGGRAPEMARNSAVRTQLSDNQESGLEDDFRSPEALAPVEEPTEVMVSHVPDVPYVPRKPLPKRDRSTLLDSSLKSTPGQPANAPGRSATTPAAPTSRPSTQPSQIQPQPPTQPSASVPSLEISSKSSGTGRAIATTGLPGSLPIASLPSASLPSADANGVGAQSARLPTAPTGNLTSLPAPPVATSLPVVPPAHKPYGVTNAPESGMPAMPSLSMQPVNSKPLPSAANRLSAQPVSVPSGNGLPSGQMPPAIPSTATPSASASATPFAQVPSLPPNLPTGFPTDLPVGLPPASPARGPAPATVGLPPASPSSSMPSNRAADQNERLRMEIPHVIVKLLGPGDLMTGTPTEYELQVQNSDPLVLSGLILRMETPPGVEVVANVAGANTIDTEKAEDGATLLTWNVSQVAAGGQARLPLQIKADAARNFAVAIEWTVLPQSGVDEISVKQADLQVALEGPVEVEKNAPNAYRLRVSNPGSAPARAVIVQVTAGTQPASQVEIGDLKPGQTEVVEMDLTFEKAGQVSIAAAGLSGSVRREAQIAVNVRQAILNSKVTLPENVALGTPVTATVELTNTGDAPARKVQAGLVLPTGTETTQLPAGVSRDGDKLMWDLELVPPGQVVTVPIELKLPSPGQHEISFACVAPDGSVCTTSGQINVEAFADLKLLVNDPVSPAPVGSPVSYELSITNRGSREARGVLVVAQFSDGIEPESAAGLKHRVVPGQVRFDVVPQIAAGETIKLTIVARASLPGVHRFRAEVRCDENEARLVEEESTRFLESTGRVASPPSNIIQR
ncbi:MAG: hypothetical protein IT423_04795 [Pirellulaceae bacterium]|nr:hypothetical protein [Pirellulaceae bacterium]